MNGLVIKLRIQKLKGFEKTLFAKSWCDCLMYLSANTYKYVKQFMVHTKRKIPVQSISAGIHLAEVQTLQRFALHHYLLLSH